MPNITNTARVIIDLVDAIKKHMMSFETLDKGLRDLRESFPVEELAGDLSKFFSLENSFDEKCDALKRKSLKALSGYQIPNINHDSPFPRVIKPNDSLNAGHR